MPRISGIIKAVSKRSTYYSLTIIAILLLSTIFVFPVQASPLAQDPRGDDNGGEDGSGGGNGGNGGGNGDDTGPAGPNCGAVNGQVLNWGFGPEPNVGVKLSTGSWNVTVETASDGRYGFGGLGVGVARLRLLLAPGQAEHLQPWVQDAGVYLNCDFPTIANLAVFSSPQIEPPATIEMTAPGSLTAESQTPVRLTIKNGLPNDITNVIVTDLMPPGLVALTVEATAADPQNAQIIDGGAEGQLVVVFLDRLRSEAEANIFITVAAAPDVPVGTQITNMATLFYRESVADKAQTTFTISRDAGVAPSQITAPTLEAEAESVVEPQTSPTPPFSTEVTAEEAEEGEAFVPPPESVPTTGEEWVPPGLLPTTGDQTLLSPSFLSGMNFGLIFPLGGVGVALIGLAFLAYRFLRSTDRPK